MTGTSMNTVTYSYASYNDVYDAASAVGAVVTSSVTVASYTYLGTRHAHTYLSQPNVDNVAGDFSNWDRFDRPTSNFWYAATPDTNIYEVAITYDRNSGITSTTDSLKKNGSNRNFDVLYTNDDLGRLIKADEGTLSGSISNRSRQEDWTYSGSQLSQTGNWGRHRRDLDGDVNFNETNELDDSRTHNIVNELTARDLDSNGGTTGNNYSLTYDAAGNMANDYSSNYTYAYDAFGRLRTVTAITGGRGLVSEFRYNGLGMKIGWHYDADADNDTDSNDPWYYTCYSEKWQAITVFRGSDSNAKERYIYHAAGMDGTGSASYIDDMVLRDWDKNSGWTSAADSTKEVRHYYLHNWRHDVSAILTDTGKQVESVKYLSYGIPIGLPVGDVDCDGDFDATDEDAIKNYSGPYDVRYDTDLDGDVDEDDKNYALSITGTHQTLGFGVLTSTAVFNRKGYAGYEHAWELDGTKYHVRHRVLDSELGRWTRRDPLGYVDGMGVYEYAASIAISGTDPFGLAWQPTWQPSCQLQHGCPTSPAQTPCESQRQCHIMPEPARSRCIMECWFEGQPYYNQRCCDEYFRKNPGSTGSNVCCGGMQIICLPPLTRPDPFLDQFWRCVLEQEQCVQGSIRGTCGPDDDGKEPSVPPGSGPGTQACINVTNKLACLQAQLRCYEAIQCPPEDPECLTIKAGLVRSLTQAIEAQRAKIVKYCMQQTPKH